MTVRIGVSYIRAGSGVHYVNALRDAGAEPVVLSTEDSLPRWPTAKQARLILDPGYSAVTQLDDLDGLLLTGGGDIDPMLYRDVINGSETPNWSRDHLETAQFHRARANGLPIFGICRGLQFLNVAMGGSLVQHLPTAEDHTNAAVKESRSHLVQISAESVLARIVDPERPNSDLVVGVNSYHHQGISPERLAPGLVATATTEAPDGSRSVVVEGIETLATRSGHEFVVGVQWHPERKADSTPWGERQSVSFFEMSRRLFEAFVGAAAARRLRDERRSRVALQV